MSHLLYIESSPRKDQSSSIKVAQAFLDEYRNTHAAINDITTINLWNTKLPEFNGDIIDAKYAILQRQNHTQQQKAAWSQVVDMIDEFKAADKYVMSVPMWNFGIPYILKHYLDILVQPSYTFSYSSEGYRGLVTNKPIILICSSGGSYGPDSPVDFQRKYLETVLRFIGFTDIRFILVELTATPNSKEMIEIAMAKAREMAKEF